MKHIYHGTIQKDLDTIKPFKRFTPGGEDLADTIPPRIYATYEPAFAVAHSFPWSSEDGIDITTVDGIVTIVVPKDKQQVLEQKICIYTLPDSEFEHTIEEETGLTFHSTQEVQPIENICFQTVIEAMKHFGGTIRLT
jgi:hypothetical protein